MVWWCALVVLCVAAIEAVKRNEWRLVNISQGPVRGRMESYGIYAFYNIPYATAPTDEDKFKVICLHFAKHSICTLHNFTC